MTEIEKIAEKATAIIFLNAQWIGSLADTLKDYDLYSEMTHQLVEHARKENKQVFNDINELRGKASTDTIPRAEVAAALEELRDKVQVALTAETLDLLTLRQEIMIDGIDATMTALGLAPKEKQ